MGLFEWKEEQVALDVTVEQTVKEKLTNSDMLTIFINELKAMGLWTTKCKIFL